MLDENEFNDSTVITSFKISVLRGRSKSPRAIRRPRRGPLDTWVVQIAFTSPSVSVTGNVTGHSVFVPAHTLRFRCCDTHGITASLWQRSVGPIHYCVSPESLDDKCLSHSWVQPSASARPHDDMMTQLSPKQEGSDVLCPSSSGRGLQNLSPPSISHLHIFTFLLLLSMSKIL